MAQVVGKKWSAEGPNKAAGPLANEEFINDAGTVNKYPACMYKFVTY